MPEPRSLDLIFTAEDEKKLRSGYTLVEGAGESIAGVVEVNIAEADFIISRDSDLLDLMKWDQAEGRAFQQRFRSLKIVSPIEFLEIMEK